MKLATHGFSKKDELTATIKEELKESTIKKQSKKIIFQQYLFKNYLFKTRGTYRNILSTPSKSLIAVTRSPSRGLRVKYSNLETKFQASAG